MMVVNKDDLTAVEEVLKRQGMSYEEVEAKKQTEWTFFLQYCRRHVPAAEELERRLGRIFEVYAMLQDATTKEPLFRAKSRNVWTALLKHVRKGCFSDPEGLSLYFERRYNRQGLVLWRCIRGTNSIEGYHKQKRDILSRTFASPKLLHLLLLEFNFRHNIRMAIKHRGLPVEFGGHYHQYHLDSIQVITADLDMSSRYSNWPIAHMYHDSGERAGLKVCHGICRPVLPSFNTVLTLNYINPDE